MGSNQVKSSNFPCEIEEFSKLSPTPFEGRPFNSDDFFQPFDIKTLSPAKILGSGTYGIVYDVKNNTVLKINTLGREKTRALQNISCSTRIIAEDVKCRDYDKDNYTIVSTVAKHIYLFWDSIYSEYALTSYMNYLSNEHFIRPLGYNFGDIKNTPFAFKRLNTISTKINKSAKTSYDNAMFHPTQNHVTSMLLEKADTTLYNAFADKEITLIDLESITMQVLQALKIMQQADVQVSHNDLTLANIFLFKNPPNSKHKYQAKIGDWGISNKYSENKLYHWTENVQIPNTFTPVYDIALFLVTVNRVRKIMSRQQQTGCSGNSKRYKNSIIAKATKWVFQDKPYTIYIPKREDQTKITWLKAELGNNLKYFEIHKSQLHRSISTFDDYFMNVNIVTANQDFAHVNIDDLLEYLSHV